MIANQRQYRQAQAQLEEFQTARELADARGPSDGVDPRIHAMMGTAFASEADVLREQIKRYEKLVAGQVRQIKGDSLADIGLALIEARIANGMTQKALGQTLGLAEQQIQRYEASEYTGASLDRLQEVADACGVQVSMRVDVQSAGARGAIASTSGKSRASGKPNTRRTPASRTAAKRTPASARSQEKSVRASMSSSKNTRKSSRSSKRTKGT